MPLLDSLKTLYDRVATELGSGGQRLGRMVSGAASHLNNASSSNELASSPQRPAKGIRFAETEEVHDIHKTTSECSDEECEMDTAPRHQSMNRRHSVAAESFDPEQDESEDEEALEHEDNKTDEQRARLETAVKDILLFRCLDKKQNIVVIRAMREMQVIPGQVIITQGEEGDNFYIIEKGKYDIYVNTSVDTEQKYIGSYVDQGSFGELALMYNTPRAATIIASTPGCIWSLDRATFRRIVLKRAYRKRQMYERLLKSVPLLTELSDYERANLADALISKEYAPGEQIIAQGDEGKQMFFVEEGQVRIVRRSTDPKQDERQVNLLSKGSYFGELALITHNPRVASAYAVGPTKLSVLDIKSFERLMGPCIKIMQRNVDSYRAQIREAFGSEAEINDLRGYEDCTSTLG